jgi:hypothetical protein
MKKSITFRGQISPIMSAIRMGGDVMRISFDVPLTERENAIGLLALTDQPLRVEISVDSKAPAQAEPKGPHGDYWHEMFRAGFQNYPDLIEVLDCAGPQIKLRLHDLFEVHSLNEVSPAVFEDWCAGKGLHSLITLSRQAQAKIAA